MSVSRLSEQTACVPHPTPAVTEKLKAMLGEFSSHIASEQADSIASTLGISKTQLMVELIPLARKFAVVPISDYTVGSCAMGNSGDLYFGANIEFTGQNLDATIHSEQFAATNAMGHGEKGLQYLAVSSAPCGYCRQFLNELKGGLGLNVLITGCHPMTLEQLLPCSFGPSDLKVDGGMMDQVKGSLALPKAFDELADYALRAANLSYAPYSQCQSGIALKTKDGKYYTGWYAENAAFNPSMQPMQAAVIMLLASGHTYEDICGCALVEKAGVKLTQQHAAADLLAALAPEAAFSTYYAS